MNWYNAYFETVERNPHTSPEQAYICACVAISESTVDTEQTYSKLKQVTKAFEDYKEELNNERIASAV